MTNHLDYPFDRIIPPPRSITGTPIASTNFVYQRPRKRKCYSRWPVGHSRATWILATQFPYGWLIIHILSENLLSTIHLFQCYTSTPGIDTSVSHRECWSYTLQTWIYIDFGRWHMRVATTAQLDDYNILNKYFMIVIWLFFREIFSHFVRHPSLWFSPPIM